MNDNILTDSVEVLDLSSSIGWRNRPRLVNKMSDMAGVECDDEDKDAKINLDPDNFAAAMKNLLTKMEDTGGSEFLESDTDDEDLTAVRRRAEILGEKEEVWHNFGSTTSFATSASSEPQSR